MQDSILWVGLWCAGIMPFPHPFGEALIGEKALMREEQIASALGSEECSAWM